MPACRLTIPFVPGRATLYATFRISDEEFEQTDSTDRVYTVDLVDEADVTHATIRKTLHVTTDQGKAT